MAQQPLIHKESPEKDFKHSTSTPSGTGAPHVSGAGSVIPSRGQMPAGEMSAPIAEGKGCPQITMAPYQGTTAKYTLTDVIMHQQAVDAGQAPPKRLADLPEDAIKKAKLMGYVHCPNEELEALRKEDAAKQRATPGQPPVTAGGAVHTAAGGGVMHPAPGAHPAAAQEQHGMAAGKTSDEAATQAKYDNRGGGEVKR